MTDRYVCPGCGATARAGAATFPKSVFTLNYVHRTREEALAAPQAPLALEECAACGLVHVPPGEPIRSRYDDAYENTQEHSPAFQEHLRDVRDLLVRSLAGDAPCRVLEVGCGKGGFLRLLAETAGWSGDGYDTTYDGPLAVGTLRFHREYVEPATVAGEHYDLIVCRHVVEHVPQIGTFLQMLAELLQGTGADRLMVETPDFDWIVGNEAFWDIFHEHRNYFSRETLAFLCRRAGLRVLDHRLTFGGQYQNLLLEQSAVDEDAATPPTSRPLVPFRNAIAAKAAGVAAAIREAAAGGAWAIWGAGAKGVCLANHLRHDAGLSPAAVFDINPAKQGSFLPGHGTPVLAPTAETLRPMALIVVANPVYAAEIGELLAAAGATAARLLVLR